MIERESQMLESLYDAVFHVPLGRFQDVALDLLKSVIPFDSAVWAVGVHEPYQLHAIHLHNQDPALVPLYDGGLFPQDFVRWEAVRQPGTTINMADLISREAYVQLPIYDALCRRFGVEQAMATCTMQPATGLAEYIALWRRAPDKPFSEAERRAKQRLMPHLAAGWRHRQLLHLRLGDQRDAPARGFALADPLGVLHCADARFVVLLRQAFPTWTGSRLPAPLVAQLSAGTPELLLGKLRVQAQRDGPLFALMLSADLLLGRLTPAEARAIRGFARGATYQAVASTLGLRPATVRNQISRAYAKLGVTSKVELARLLDTSDA
jgi:DNA-binding CsgD family transcriptional regulator